MTGTVIICESSELSGAIAAIGPGAKLSWTYLGTRPEFFYAIYHRFSQFADYVCSGEFINETAQRLREEFLNFDRVIAKSPLDLLWSAGSVAEKSPLSNPLFYRVCCAVSLPRILNRCEGTLLVICDDAFLAVFLWQLARRSGLCEAHVKVSDRITLSGGVYSGVRRYRKSQALTASQSAARFVHQLQRRRALVGNLRRKYDRDLRALEAEMHALLVTWAGPGSFSKGANPEKDDFFGELPSWLRARGLNVAFLANPLDWIHPVEAIYEGAVEADTSVLFIEDCIDEDVFQEMANCFLKQRLQLKKRWNVDGVDLTPLIIDSFYHDKMTARPLFAIQFYYVAEFLALRGIAVEHLFYPYENQPWEKALRLGFRKSLPRTKQIAYLHGPCSDFWLSCFPSKVDLNAGHIPDLLACHGVHWKDRLAKDGFPTERIVLWPAFRFEYLTTAQKGERGSETEVVGSSLRVLVALVIDRGQSLEMLVKCVEASKGIPEVKFEIRFHPRMGHSEDVLNQALQLTQLAALPTMVSVRSRPLANAFAENGVFIGNGSSMEFEAANAGLRTVCLLSEFFVDQNVMPIEEYDFTARTSEELKSVLDHLWRKPGLRRCAPWGPEKTQMYFEPVTENSKAAVMKLLARGQRSV